MKYTIENVTAKDKRRALSLAYRVLTDRKTMHAFGGTTIAQGDKPDLFTYDDMLTILAVMFREIEEGWVH